MHGVPVLARVGSSGADFVEATAAGVTYMTDAALPARLHSIRERRREYADASRRAYLKHLATEAWLGNLLNTYAEAVHRRGRPRA